MVGIGIVLATMGYGVFYYGGKLWQGDPQSLAYAFGFTSTNAAAVTADANAAKGRGVNGTATKVAESGLGVILLGPLGGLLPWKPHL